MSSKRLTKDPHRQSRKTGRKVIPEEEWIIIPVPAATNELIWEQAQLLAETELPSFEAKERASNMPVERSNQMPSMWAYTLQSCCQRNSSLRVHPD